MSSMTNEKQTAFEIETEFFGFTPVSFVDDVINAVNEYIYAAGDSLLLFLTKNDLKSPVAVQAQEVRKYIPLVVYLRLRLIRLVGCR